MRVAEKKRYKNNFFVIFHPFAQTETLSGWICTKFGIGPLADVINCAEFFVDWFRGIDFVRG